MQSKTLSLNIKKWILLLTIYSLNIIFCNIINFQGDSWIAISYSDSSSSLNTEFSYIPFLSKNIKLSDEDTLDFEFSERLIYKSDNIFSIVPYRGWVRYTTSGMEIRLGLQKISFGPAQILRSMAWFDNVDIKNPIATTDGVYSFRIKNYFSDSFSTWFWMIESEMSKFSIGGRAEFSTKLADIGLTLHRDEVDQTHIVGQFPIIVKNPNSRIGLDVRYDGIIGLWNETTTIIEDKSSLHTCITIGADYTLPYFQGIYFMYEHLNYHKYFDNSEDAGESIDHNIDISSFMMGVPIGIFNDIMIVTSIDWGNDDINYFMRWSSSFDDFSINIMSLVATESNIQLMLTYNH